ncbi:hypothetical protein J6590_094546 [Homalodisca vitripennis]|nr:hypothetical protein J6590_094546 [Homalodisca vitripennis]
MYASHVSKDRSPAYQMSPFILQGHVHAPRPLCPLRVASVRSLIEEVRARPVICDSTLEVYRDIGMKDKAWDEIAQVTLKDSN